jgi:hypothetical protein
MKSVIKMTSSAAVLLAMLSVSAQAELARPPDVSEQEAHAMALYAMCLAMKGGAMITEATEEQKAQACADLGQRAIALCYQRSPQGVSSLYQTEDSFYPCEEVPKVLRTGSICGGDAARGDKQSQRCKDYARGNDLNWKARNAYPALILKEPSPASTKELDDYATKWMIENSHK